MTHGPGRKKLSLKNWVIKALNILTVILVFVYRIVGHKQETRNLVIR